MNSVSNATQGTDLIPEISCAQSENIAATHLIAYLKKLKIQKIFRKCS